MIKLPSRQVHLDFHTSEAIEGVGSLFDKKQFQKAVKAGRLNSITVFAKCHHGWSYYPTTAGKMHPTLAGRNLLGEQIEACHEIGVRAPIYFTVGWSANDAAEHPEWTMRNKDGSIGAWNVDFNADPDDPRGFTSWIHLCPSGEYRELMLEQTREICGSLTVDGFFYDICFIAGACHCDNCLSGMKALGLDPENDADARKYYIRNWQSFQKDCNRIIKAGHPDAIIFYNGGASQYAPEWHAEQTHFELEDLPSTWGGYDRFPIRAKYFAATGKDYMAMSGKFHTSWGEFGGFKHPDAMKYEAAAMIAYGARCSFGDQLHPVGRMDMDTYEALAHAYSYVEEIEEYGLDGTQAATLGFCLSGSFHDDQGIVNMLLETQTDFEVVHPTDDLKRFETVILPGGRFLDSKSAKAINAYVENSGSLLVIGDSGLDAKMDRFAIDCGARYLGPANRTEDYLVAGKALARDLVHSPFFTYMAAIRASVKDAEVLAAVREIYFDRTYRHYCSHRNTPNMLEDAPHPGAWRKGNVIYLAHRLGKIYRDNGARVHRQFFKNALDLLHKKPLASASLPSAGRMNVIHQVDKRRYVVHLLYAPALKRGDVLVIEDLVPLYDVPVTLNVPKTIKGVRLAPSGKKLSLTKKGRKVSVVVPKLQCHQAVVFSY